MQHLSFQMLSFDFQFYCFYESHKIWLRSKLYTREQKEKIFFNHSSTCNYSEAVLRGVIKNNRILEVQVL